MGRMLSKPISGHLLPDWCWVIEMLGGWANTIAQQLLTNYKLPNSPTAKLLGIFFFLIYCWVKIWLNKVTSKIDQNEKNINYLYGLIHGLIEQLY